MSKDMERGDTVVLLVEDDAAVLALLGNGLQQAGFRVTTAPHRSGGDSAGQGVSTFWRQTSP
jgi:DNA-binding response OmpR family regulator